MTAEPKVNSNKIPTRDLKFERALKSPSHHTLLWSDSSPQTLVRVVLIHPTCMSAEPHPAATIRPLHVHPVTSSPPPPPGGLMPSTALLHRWDV
jgi:hypothetical protein